MRHLRHLRRGRKYDLLSLLLRATYRSVDVVEHQVGWVAIGPTLGSSAEGRKSQIRAPLSPLRKLATASNATTGA